MAVTLVVHQGWAKQVDEADDRMKVALDEIEQTVGGWGSPHPAFMQEFFSEFGIEKLKVRCAPHLAAQGLSRLEAGNVKPRVPA